MDNTRDKFEIDATIGPSAMDARATNRDAIAADQNTGSDPYEFSLGLGGPLFQLLSMKDLIKTLLPVVL